MLTVKFGKPRSNHRSRVSIGFKIQESADGSRQFAVARFLLYLVKEIHLLKESLSRRDRVQGGCSMAVYLLIRKSLLASFLPLGKCA